MVTEKEDRKMEDLVYVAGPLTNGETRCDDEFVEPNILKACEVADVLLSNGIAPYVPHLTWWWQKKSKVQHHYDTWIEVCKVAISRCQALYRIEGPSKGADIEVGFAEELNIPVFYDIDELIAWSDARKQADVDLENQIQQMVDGDNQSPI